jgi:hypothetical protein
MARTALIIIDMLTTYDFEDAEKLIASVEEMLPQMAELRERALDEGAVTVYVNDSYGDWRSIRCSSSWPAIRSSSRRRSSTCSGRRRWTASCWSGRSPSSASSTRRSTPTSAIVPRDAVASIHPHLAEAALELMERNMRAEIGAASEVQFSR